MAGAELADLTATTTLAGTDLMYAVVDPAGTPLDRKATVATVQSSMVRQVLPTLATSAQMWGLPDLVLTGSAGTAQPGATWVMCEVRRTMTVTSLMSVVTTGPAGAETLRFGVWQHDPATGKAGTLVTDFGTVAVGAGATGLFSVTGTAVLTAGHYWFGMRQSAYITCRVWTLSIPGVSSVGNVGAPMMYGSPGSAAFGNAPSLLDHDSARTFLLARWN